MTRLSGVKRQKIEYDTSTFPPSVHCRLLTITYSHANVGAAQGAKETAFSNEEAQIDGTSRELQSHGFDTQKLGELVKSCEFLNVVIKTRREKKKCCASVENQSDEL